MNVCIGIRRECLGKRREERLAAVQRSRHFASAVFFLVNVFAIYGGVDKPYRTLYTPRVAAMMWGRSGVNWAGRLGLFRLSGEVLRPSS